MRGLEQIPWVYDAGMRFLERGRFRRWREWLIAGVRGRVLEVGCGTGRNLPLYRPGVTLVAVDPHRDPLVAARRRAPGVPVVQARAEALPFRDGAFDTVVSALVFCSVDDPAAGLAEVRRVLAPGGALRMLEHVRARGRLQAGWQDLVSPAWRRVTGGCRLGRETERAVEAAGFRIDPATRRERGTIRRFEAAPAPATARR